MESTDIKHSDYIVYVDESGDHSLETINSRYPLFVLSICVFKKETYTHQISPAIKMLKFDTFGHDMVILHEYDLRKKSGAFSMLNKLRREELMRSLSNQIDQAEFTLIPVVVNKLHLKKERLDSPNIYHLAMKHGLEALYNFLSYCEQSDSKTYVVFEARGRKEDAELELEFRRVCNFQNSFKTFFPFEIVVADKKSNSCGLQFADMTARPVGLGVLNPSQPNRAFEILKKKLYLSNQGLNEIFMLPTKAKDPEVVLEVQTPVR